MRIIGNLIWWLFGGLEAAIGYFTGSLAMALTIIGIPVAIWCRGKRNNQSHRLHPYSAEHPMDNLRWSVGMAVPHLLRHIDRHHHHRNTFRQAAFQDGGPVARTVRQGCGVASVMECCILSENRIRT